MDDSRQKKIAAAKAKMRRTEEDELNEQDGCWSGLNQEWDPTKPIVYPPFPTPQFALTIGMLIWIFWVYRYRWPITDTFPGQDQRL